MKRNTINGLIPQPHTTTNDAKTLPEWALVRKATMVSRPILHDLSSLYQQTCKYSIFGELIANVAARLNRSLQADR